TLAEAAESTVAGLAGRALRVQAQAAMGAMVGIRILQVHRPLAARAYAFCQPCRGHVIAELLPPLTLGLLFCQPLFFQEAVQRQYCLPAHQEGQDDAYGIPHIAAITRQVRY